MRATVIVSEYLVYIPATVTFLRHYGRARGVGATSHSVAMVAFLMQPATMLIDHGHFQYNTVMLGFVIAALSSIYAGRPMWSCIFFVAALGYKQMALYYSPIIFAYLLGSCMAPRISIRRLLGIATITTLSLVALFTPLIIGSLYDVNRGVPFTNTTTPALLDALPYKPNPQSIYYHPLLQITQSLHRIFPFARGLFEDKVANFWCALNIVFKIRNLEHVITLPRLSLYFTFMSILAPMLLIGAIPRPSLLPYALASSAWGFFLFSFQVHEKSVLLPLMPMTLLLGGKDGLGRDYRAWIGWANMVGTWTLYPLLKRDGLRTPYFVITLLWAYLLGLPPTSVAIYHDQTNNQTLPGKERQTGDLSTGTKVLHEGYYMVMILWHGLEAFIPPPQGKPDLWVVVNVCIGALAFGICYLWSTWQLVLGTGLLDGYFGDRKRTMDKEAAAGREKKTQ